MPTFVSPSGLVIPKATIPVADATGKDVSASGLVTATARAAVNRDRIIHDLDA